jgi:YegS/Rv2252/BmrU family lipid kinase
MTKPYAFVVLNPVAGTTDPERLERRIIRRFESSGWTLEIHRTEAQEQIPKIVSQAVESRPDMVVAVGGDGTVSEVADGLVGTGVPLGLIPAGTGNVLARDLEIPLMSPRAIRLLVGPHKTREIDALRINDRHFFLNVSIGTSAAAMHDTKRDEKRQFGFLAYIGTGIQKLLGVQPTHFTLQVDGRTHRANASDVIIANSGILGFPAFRLGEEIAIDDGRMGICIIRARTAWDYIRLMWDALLGRPQRDPRYHCLTATEQITVSSDPALPVQGDGDPIGHGSLEAVIVPKALKVIVGKPQPQLQINLPSSDEIASAIAPDSGKK